MRVGSNIDEIYLSLAKDLLHAPIVENNKINLDGAAATTGGTRELENVKIVLTDIHNSIVSIRGISPVYMFAEWLWYFTGRNDLKFISMFGKIWEQMTDDGETCNSAYGYIMKYAHGFDQIEKVIELLEKDPDSRRAVINLNTPNENVIDTNDEPCTIAIQFLIRKNQLRCTVMMRSNDIWFGFPYDVAFFTELQKYVADRLGVEYGSYTHFVVSLHMYDRNYDAISKMVENPVPKKFTFNRSEFHVNKEFIASLIETAIKHCSKEFTLNKMKEYMVQFFGFKEDIENEN